MARFRSSDGRRSCWPSCARIPRLPGSRSTPAERAAWLFCTRPTTAPPIASCNTPVTLAEKTYGKQHIEVARGLNALGMLCKYTGRFVEGRLYKRALVVATRAAGADSEDVAVIYHNIGGIEHAAGRYQHAEGPARLGVTIREKLLGPDHPSVAEDVAALAAILDGQERFAESEPMYERVLPLFRARRAHYDVAVNLHNLAAAHAAQHKFASAQKMYREAEKLKQKLLGDDHPDTALTAYGMGVLARARGDHDEALARIGRAERVFHKTLGMVHPHTVEARRTLAALEEARPKGWPEELKDARRQTRLIRNHELLRIEHAVRVFRVHLGQQIDEDPRDAQIAVPLAVGGDDPPRRRGPSRCA